MRPSQGETCTGAQLWKSWLDLILIPLTVGFNRIKPHYFLLADNINGGIIVSVRLAELFNQNPG